MSTAAEKAAKEKKPDTAPDTTAEGGKSDAYRVLARKYRPQNFAELKGQDALVRTLTNAIEQGRVAHAFMLTGVRGVGKTTTARIIARALNCIGPDGTGGPTPHPCGVCEHCTAIGADRHVDVLEMDAASRTGVDDIREIIDSVRYGTTSARFKVYIIDEVHMLSKAAFNALLKTLEEPPDHVKFVFATTEIRKVPVTVLSRCQRFDLKRIDVEILNDYFTEITRKENVTAAPQAIRLIARAADGSVRDGLSLLDRAISLEGGNVTEQQVRDMLGLADRTVVLDLMEVIMKGDAAAALDILDALHKAGADPLVVLQDLLELTHFLTRARAVPETAKDTTLPEAERTRGVALANSLGMAVLTRTWQILLKGIGEVQHAPDPVRAAEMVVLRLIYAADLPPPGDLVKHLTENSAQPLPQKTGGGPASSGATALAFHPEAVAAAATAPMPHTWREAVALFGEKREAVLHGHLYSNVSPVKFERGRIEINLEQQAPSDLPAKISRCLSDWTGERWVVSVTNTGGKPSLSAQDREIRDRRLREAQENPAVQKALAAFPGARIIDIRDRT